jgi:twitching motility protein PilT
MSLNPVLDAYLKEVVEAGGSDLHLESGAPPAMRLQGMIHFMDETPLENEDLEELLLPILDEARSQIFLETGNVDLSYEVEGMARFRVNILLQHRGIGGVFRIIPTVIPTLDELGLPKILKEIAGFLKGLVIVTGPTGSGKSTTLAAMIHHINQNRNVHVITIEDPIEFVHVSDKALIQQREIGSHARNFSTALRASLRESPDIVLVGEMRDLETIAEAIRAAETGHLVFGTLHTNSAAKTVDRIIDVFPADEQEQIRSMLSGSLKAVVAQQLLRTADEQGRLAVQEIMLVNFGIAGLIREAKTSQIPSFINMGTKEGMQTMDQHLVQLVQEGRVDVHTAFERCLNKDTLVRAGLEDPGAGR